MFFLYSLQGLTPLPIELPPSYLGLLNSAHLRFAIQLYKLMFVGERANAACLGVQGGRINTRSPQAKPKTGA